MLKSVIDRENAINHINEFIKKIHYDGPVDPQILQYLAIIKKFYPDIFVSFDSKVASVLGLFYKLINSDKKDCFSLAYSVLGDTIREEFQSSYTPIQASIKKGIDENISFSFSAPTSSGKSFLFRDLIINAKDDIVIIVPSRALISEYMIRLRKILSNQKDVLILDFVDDINRKKTKRRVFVLTPERVLELFKYHFSISLFLFDEAQLADDKEKRGITFDIAVRKAIKDYPDAKKVFAHPFIKNPEAQFSRNHIFNKCSSFAYKQNSVGKIFFEKKDGKVFIFDPYNAEGYKKQNKIEWASDIITESLQTGKRLLIYVSKNSIYNRSFKKDFEKYIDFCENLQDNEALQIIKEIKNAIAADQKKSDLISLMRKGIVIHHGSIPLNVRFLIEKFINAGYAKICFATSTLLQGINMPFDVVWVHNFKFEGSEKDNKYLALKNLIGRAGRSSDKPIFDYGCVITSNAQRMCENIVHNVEISNKSLLDDASKNNDDFIEEIINSIKENTYDDTYQMPKSKLDRLSSNDVFENVRQLLDLIFEEGKLISGDRYRELKTSREKVKTLFKSIFAASLNRELTKTEQSVLSTAITIFLWQIQGKTFREIIRLRYNYISLAADVKKLKEQLQNNKISQSEYDKKYKSFRSKYSPAPIVLPNKRVHAVQNIPSVPLDEINYDHLVYDTYDYIDKVISFSLSNVFTPVFEMYYEKTMDNRACSMVNYLRYNTKDKQEILLLRYGFSFEDIAAIKKYIVEINEDEIRFSSEISKLKDETVYQLILRYI